MAKLPSFFISTKKVCQITAKLSTPIPEKYGLPRKLPRNRPFLQIVFRKKICPENFWKFPAKQAIFSMSLTLKNRRNLTFFPNLSEALILEWTIACVESISAEQRAKNGFFWRFAYAKNGARAKIRRRGWGRGRKKTLAVNLLDFENRSLHA